MATVLGDSQVADGRASGSSASSDIRGHNPTTLRCNVRSEAARNHATHQLVLSALVLLAAACAAPRPTPAPATSPTNLSPQPSATVSSSPATVRDPNPAISIAAGITPRLTAAEVAELAVDRIHSMERTVGQVVKPPRVLAIRATGVEGGIEWRVDAEGTFTSGRPRVSPPPVAASGYFIISDADGMVIGFGFP
jgi:hypothetical protein